MDRIRFRDFFKHYSAVVNKVAAPADAAADAAVGVAAVRAAAANVLAESSAKLTR